MHQQIVDVFEQTHCLQNHTTPRRGLGKPSTDQLECQNPPPSTQPLAATQNIHVCTTYMYMYRYSQYMHTFACSTSRTVGDDNRQRPTHNTEHGESKKGKKESSKQNTSNQDNNSSLYTQDSQPVLVHVARTHGQKHAVSYFE